MFECNAMTTVIYFSMLSELAAIPSIDDAMDVITGDAIWWKVRYSSWCVYVYYYVIRVVGNISDHCSSLIINTRVPECYISSVSIDF